MSTNANTFTSLASLIEQEQEATRKANPSKPPVWFNDSKLTEEEREAVQKERTRADLSRQARSMFQNFYMVSLKTVPGPKYLLAIPEMMSHHSIIGTNAVLRTLFSNEVTPERVERFSELQKHFWVGGHSCRPTSSDLLHYLRRTDSAAYSIGNSKVSECFWLYMLCLWVDCLTSDLTNQINNVFLETDANELDFTSTLDHANPRDSVILDIMRKQYLILEARLSRM